MTIPTVTSMHGNINLRQARLALWDPVVKSHVLPSLFRTFFPFRQNFISQNDTHQNTYLHVHVQILPKHVHIKETVKTILHNMFPLLEYVQLAFLQCFKSFHVIPTIWPPSAKSARKRPPCARQDSLSQDSSFSQHKQCWLSKGNKRIAVQLSLSTKTTIKCENHIIASVSIWGFEVMQHTIPTVYFLTVTDCD